MQLTDLSLLPMPRVLRAAPGACALSSPRATAVPQDCPRLAVALSRLGELGTALAVGIDSAGELRRQGYRLTIGPDGVKLIAADEEGACYGVMTVLQLKRQAPAALPCGVIEDWPDIAQRGAMLDISRDKVPTLETLYLLVDALSEWKLNHLQLYIEHTFAYQNHPVVWAESSPLTAADIRSLDEYCRDRCIELAPNQNSLGHLARWLKHDRYRHLAECPDGWLGPGGDRRDEPWSLDPTKPASLAFLAELYAEYLPNFSSRIFNVGCDESWDIGQGGSKAACQRLGKETVYVQFLTQLQRLVAAHGCTMQYWGDMVWAHGPEAVIDLTELPREAVMVDWGYIRDYPFAAHGAALRERGLRFWFAPGTATWSTLLGCNEAAFGSNRSAAEAALEYGAEGILNTDWGDGGHWQHLPVSFTGFAAGAAMSWSASANPDATIRAALAPHVFCDAAAVMGDVALALADTWEMVGDHVTQANLLDRILRGGLTQTLPDAVTETTLLATDAHLDRARQQLADARMQRSDAALVRDEFLAGIRLARHACRVGLAVRRGEAANAGVCRVLAADLEEIIAEQRRLWLARNRPGGLADSLQLLAARLRDYRS